MQEQNAPPRAAPPSVTDPMDTGKVAASVIAVIEGDPVNLLETLAERVSDAVLAIAMTILVLDLKAPDVAGRREYDAALLAALPRPRFRPRGVDSVMSPGLALRQVGSQESSAGESLTVKAEDCIMLRTEEKITVMPDSALSIMEIG